MTIKCDNRPVAAQSEYGPAAEYLHLLSGPMWDGAAGRRRRRSGRARWTMTNRTLDHGIPLGEASAEYDWWIVSAPALAAELTPAGMTVTSTGDGLVVASGAARPA
jgi:hypothetical protein